MVVVCQQPNYFPWLGYLEQCARADALIVLDSVQWLRRGWQHRARIAPQNTSKVFNGGAALASHQWLTIPVNGHGHRKLPLRDLKVAPGVRWTERHWKTLQTVYGGRPYFKTQLEPLIRPWLERMNGEENFARVATESMRLCFEALDIRPRLLLRSSELPESGTKTQRLLSLCQAVGGTTYYSGIASTRYLDTALFREKSIRVIWQHWRHPEYEQGRGLFKSHLSVLDALANVSLVEIKSWLAPSPYGVFTECPSR